MALTGRFSWFWWLSCSAMVGMIVETYFCFLSCNDCISFVFEPSEMDRVVVVVDRGGPELVAPTISNSVESAGVVLTELSVFQIICPTNIAEVAQAIVLTITIFVIDINRILAVYDLPNHPLGVEERAVYGASQVTILGR